MIPIGLNTQENTGSRPIEAHGTKRLQSFQFLL